MTSAGPSSSNQPSNVTIKASSEGSSPDKQKPNEPQPKQQQIQAAPQPKPKALVERNARHIARSILEGETKLGRLQTRPTGYFRAVPILVTPLYNSLVELYSMVFLADWHPFSRVLPLVQGETMATQARKLAQYYIAAWFNDLYVCIRKSVELKNPEIFRDYFSEIRGVYSVKYDDYLVQLNSVIRPTIVHFTPEETCWIPIFQNAFGSTADPFNIGPSYDFNWPVFSSTVLQMEQRKEFKMSELKTSSSDGRPTWLFDWHDKDAYGPSMYAWFPQENNYAIDDAVIPAVIGTPITDLLGPIDWDITQEYTRTMSRQSLRVVPRKRPRQFWGSIEIRIAHYSKAWIPEIPESDVQEYDPTSPHYDPPSPPPRAPKKRKETALVVAETSGTKQMETGEKKFDCIETDMITLGDCVYDCNLSRNLEFQDRFKILKMFVFGS